MPKLRTYGRYTEMSSDTYNSDEEIPADLPAQTRQRKYIQKYSVAWEVDAEFKDWLQESSKGPNFAYCAACCIDLCLQAGRQDLRKHAYTNKHLKKYSTFSKQPSTLDIHSIFDTPSIIDLPATGKKRKEFKDEGVKEEMMIQEAEMEKVHEEKMDDDAFQAIVTYKLAEKNEQTTAVIKIPCEKKRTRSRQRYRASWEDVPSFQPWLTSDPCNVYKAICKACNVKFTADISVVKNHAKCNKHIKKLEIYKTDRAKTRRRLQNIKAIKREVMDHSDYCQDRGDIRNSDTPVGVRRDNFEKDQKGIARATLVKLIKEAGIDRNKFRKMKTLLDQCCNQADTMPEVDTGLGGTDDEEVMSRHVPLTCRDPFFRDLDRDFFTERSSRQNWFDSSPSKIFDQHFGSGLFPDDTNTGTSSLYLRSRRPPREKSGVSHVNSLKEKFSILLDVPQFTPDELKVRVAGNCIEIEGKHDERTDEHGTVSRQFVRKYNLPDDVMVDMISSSLSADGVLTIEAPKKPPEPPRPSEREVPIQKMEKSKDKI